MSHAPRPARAERLTSRLAAAALAAYREKLSVSAKVPVRQAMRESAGPYASRRVLVLNAWSSRVEPATARRRKGSQIETAGWAP